MNIGLLLAATGIAGLLGIVLHEVTHWLLWRVQGRRAVFTLDGIQPVVRVPGASLADVEARDRVAALGPLAVGLAAAVAALIASIPVTLPAIGAWLGYTGISVLDLNIAFATSA